MRYARSWLLAAALPLFAGCAMPSFFSPQPSAPEVSGQTRMQGTLTAAQGHLLFTPCDSVRTFVVTDNGETGLLQEATTLASLNKPLFADLRGRFDGSAVEGQPGALNLQTLYRVESVAKGCEGNNFKLTQFYAGGKGWVARANAQGLLIEREGQAPFAVPFVEEQAPGGGTSLSADANGEHIQLWLAPQRCDSGPRVTFLSAELRVAGEVLRGCGYLGGARAQ